LPVEATAFNTAVLLASAAMIWVAAKRFEEEPAKARTPMIVTLGLGVFFLLFQGFEWARLLSAGLTLTSTTHGSFFYLIVGMHGLHVTVGVAVLLYLYRLLRRDELTSDGFWAGRLFWYFVVGLWPILYWMVYL
jgi:heme/copper-type cytochrome/quinol oxidase subunit 3